MCADDKSVLHTVYELRIMHSKDVLSSVTCNKGCGGKLAHRISIVSLLSTLQIKGELKNKLIVHFTLP